MGVIESTWGLHAGTWGYLGLLGGTWGYFWSLIGTIGYFGGKMAGMAGHCWALLKLLEMADNGSNGWTIIEMA